MRTVLIGSVDSSKVVLEEMIRAEFPITKVYGLDETKSRNVSGYVPIHKIAEKENIPYRTFSNINDNVTVEDLRKEKPDYIFVIGLSQLVGKEILEIAEKGVIGFHPTPLPRFRGRAAMVWQMLLGIRESKCTMFFIDEGMDSGDIIGQEPYVIEKDDYAEDLSRKLQEALRVLIKRVMKEMLSDSLNPVKQNEEEATYLLKRTPEDGKIDWSNPVQDIQLLIRAVSHPYPGAFSLYEGQHKVIIWRADYLENHKYIGIPGQIAKISDQYIDIVGVDGLLRVYQYDNSDGVKLVVGHKFK